MIQVQLGADLLTLPELRCYHRFTDDAGQLGPVLAVDDPLGKTWVALDHEANRGELCEMEIPTHQEGDERVRMRVIQPANRSELIAALKKSPRKLALVKGYWYEVIAD